MSVHYDVLIVGGGHGGAQAAIALRQQKFEGTIAVISAEPELPYERPPLSKEYLAGEKTFERLLIRPAVFWQERSIDFLLSERVMAVAPAGHKVLTDRGQELDYSHLIWATGGAPRTLTCSGSDLTGVHSVRTRADIDRLMSELPATKNVVVIGGGYIGLEAAAVLTKLGKSVTLLEALPRVLARVAGEPLSRFYEAEHRAHGVDVRTDCVVDCIIGDERVTGVRLADGSLVAADMVIVGIGILPAVEALIAAGAAGENGVDVDEFCRTSLPDVYAIGDCARHSNMFAEGARVRLESVQNANDQAVTAVSAILGEGRPYRATPWFWSNQYDLRLQTVGLSAGHDDLVIRGDPATRSFSVIYLAKGRVTALDCVNSTKDYVQGRKLVEARANVARAILEDGAIPLKELI